MRPAAPRGPAAAPPPPPAGEEGPPVPSPLAALALTACAALVVVLALGAVAPEAGGPAGMAVGLTLGLGALGTVAARSVPPPAEVRLGLVAPGLRALRWLLPLLPLPLVLSELDNAVAALLPRPAPEAFTPSPELVLLLVGLRPVLEEFFFRGVLLQGLVSALGPLRGALLDAALFAALRTLFAPTLAVAASVTATDFAAGLVLVALRLATGSILPGVLLQALAAGLTLAAVGWEGAPAIPGFNAPGAHSPPELVVPALLAVGAGCAALVRAARRAPPLPPVPREPARRDADAG